MYNSSAQLDLTLRKRQSSRRLGAMLALKNAKKNSSDLIVVLRPKHIHRVIAASASFRPQSVLREQKENANDRGGIVCVDP